MKMRLRSYTDLGYLSLLGGHIWTMVSPSSSRRTYAYARSCTTMVASVTLQIGLRNLSKTCICRLTDEVFLEWILFSV